MSQREGSPWRGMNVVYFRELFDHLTSARFLVLEFLVVLLGGAVVYFAAEQIRNTTAEDPFLFLRLFAPPGQSLLSFVLVLSILVPVLAIGLGFDSISGEYNRRTMSRILAQPIYRDALLFGKFLAGLTTIAISLVTLWLLVIGFGLLRLGIPPSGEEMGRLLVFLLVTIAYAGVWLALAMLFTLLGLPTPDTLAWQQGLSRLSPGTLYGEAVVAMLNPDAQSMSTLLAQFQGRIASPLPLGQSILQAWPQIVGLIAGTILLYVIGYVAFQRQEVRA